MEICDSKMLLVSLDVFTMELDDAFLLEVCQAKLKGSSLLTLCNSGNSFFFLPFEKRGRGVVMYVQSYECGY